MRHINLAIIKYASLVAPWGVDAIRRDAELILHQDIGQGYKRLKNNRGQPCDKSKGWYGLKGACERKKRSEVEDRSGDDAQTKAAKAQLRKSIAKESAVKLAQKIKAEKVGIKKGYEIPKVAKSRVNAFDTSFPFDLPVVDDMSSSDGIGFGKADMIPKSLDDLAKKIEDLPDRIRNGKGKYLVSFYAEEEDHLPDFDKVNSAFQKIGAETINGKDSFGLPTADHFFVFENKKLRPLDRKERQEVSTAEERWNLHRSAIKDLPFIEEMKASMRSAGMSEDELNDAIQDEVKDHKATTGKLWQVEDYVFDRKPSKQSREKLEKQLQQEASDWAKSQGFTGEGVNGFSAEATAAHDIAHPATHRLIGLDSSGIHKAFGALKDKEGKPSLLAEEALVNAVEHLSRGDSKEASIQNGLRLARVLSRSGTQEEREYVRSEEFARGVIDLISNRAYRNDEYSNIMPIVRDYNIKSGTVTASGSDFTNTATGG